MSTSVKIPARPATSYACRTAAGWEGLAEALPGGGGDLLLVSDSRVWALHGTELRSLLSSAGYRVVVHLSEEGEANKSLQAVEQVGRAALRAGLERDGLLVALGGGLVGDLTGLAAALVRRGCAVVQLPTTLLAQVDAAVGGKTGCNTPEGKNLLGVFHHPVLVWSNTELLRTLPLRQWRAGLAEALKTALLDGDDFMRLLEVHADALAAGPDETPTPVIREIVERSQAFKAKVVSADERERGVRAQLNLGHSFGHALEHGASRRSLLHGEAVAVGMRWVMRWAADTGRCEAAFQDRFAALLGALKLDFSGTDGSVIEVDAAVLEQRLVQDKKRRDGNHRLVVLTGPGAWKLETMDHSALWEIPAHMERVGLLRWQEVAR